VSRQVGDVDATESPTATPNASNTELNAVALMAPPTAEPHKMNPATGSGRVSCTTEAMSAQPEERQDKHDHDDQANEIDETVHCILLQDRW
jgi:hypothetical protein